MSAETPASYEELLDRYRRLSNVQEASGVLNWDQHVTMPEGGTPARAQQLSTLSAVSHDLLTADETGDLLDDLEGADLDGERAAVVREIRAEYERAVDVPGDLVEELSTVQSENQQVWQEAKANDDFGSFAPALERLRDLHVERAEYVDPAKSPYEVLFDDSERYVSLDRVEAIFDRLREELVPLIEEIRTEGVDLPTPFEGEYDPEVQEDLSRAALDRLGFDWERGRFDTSAHPFTFGNQFDSRITTRYRRDDPIDALTATIHEFGHATYNLGLRQDQYGSPLGQPRSSGVHESQSRFWENHVGRTRAFWEGFLPTMKAHFPQVEDATVDEVYRAVNRIYPENRIRVEADELTYHLHIILRTEIGRAFVEGDLAVEEIPSVWNRKMDEYLGVRPATDTEGCLQDIHWSYRFANFQSYTIGSVLAAQLDAAMRDDLDRDVDALVREGEFEPIHEWLTENVHRPGQRYETDELVERATGEPLTADYFLDYVDEKFRTLYGL
ncbi:MAG: carboxypeptidase M32 [Haloferacaceae archaeon]